MSYILDALKKIEHEKNRRAGPGGRASISGDLFQERSRPATRGGIWKVVLLVVVASLVTGAGTWFVLLGNNRKNVAVVRPVSPLAPVPVSPPIVTPVVPVPVHSATVTAPPAAVPAAPNAGSSAREVRRSKQQIKAQQPPQYPKQTVQNVQAPADIKLSGIAWQDERAARRAVINGFLLKEGAVVSGAKINEILADRVRFLTAAGQFDIKLDAVLPSEVKR
jgi:general secretion pathway protein B